VTQSPLAAHPDAATLAAYLDRRLPDADARGVAEHLIACLSCREGLTDVARVTRGERRRKQVVGGVTALGGLAAILVLVALPRDAAVPTPPAAPAERAGEAAGVPAIRVWSGASASALAWSPVAAVAQYRVTLTDAAGDEVWAASTSDTVAPLPPGLELAAGRDYFWVVDALLPDGATATSGTRRLTR
jgi:hypothetical protein